METAQNEIPNRYLLGKLTGAEQMAFEQDYFRDAASFENILIAENGLIDSYVAGRLSPEDRNLFEQRLMITTHQRKRIAFAETLVNYASRQLVTEPDALLQTSIFARLISLRPLFSFSLAAAALFIFAAGIFWLRPGALDSSHQGDVALNSEQFDPAIPIAPAIDQALVANADKAPAPLGETGDVAMPLKKDEKAATPKAAKPVAPPVLVSTIILSIGSTRDSGGGKAFLIHGKADLVDLKLNFEGSSFSSYFAVVETADGQQIWSGKTAVSRSNNGGASASIRIPATRIRRGDYIVSLKGRTKAGIYESVADYSFAVDRR